ncbi:MAG: sulfatase-like hydrolase/transferase, partial [Thermoguttaceae bacterium]
PFDNRLLTRQLTDEAIAFLRSAQDRPFFLYLPYTAPHFPVEPHPEWEGRSDFGKYGDVVEELDHRIGEVLAVLEELGIRKQTLVVFCSDNGPQPGQAAKSVPFRGEKWSALEGGTRVPCIVHWPGVVPAGRQTGALTSAMDLLPTLCRACGIDWQSKPQGTPPIDGLDVWATLLGKEDRHPRNDLLYWHGMDPQPQAIRVGEWKLFFDRRHALEGLGTAGATAEQAAELQRYRKALKPGVANPPFLFHLSDDVGELEDLSARFPDKVEAMRDRAQELMAEIGADGILPLATPARRP